MIEFADYEPKADTTQSGNIKKQMLFVNGLYYSIVESADAYCKEMDEKGKDWFACYMDKNNSKTAIKRKITMLRQELLNLERMVEKC